MAEDLFQAIYHPLAISGKSARLRQETDYEAYIRQLIRQVLLTAPGERINRPDVRRRRSPSGVRSDQPGHRIARCRPRVPGAGTWLGRLIRIEIDRRGQHNGASTSLSSTSFALAVNAGSSMWR